MSENPVEPDALDQIRYAEPGAHVQPIYLFADSQPLFWRRGGESFLGSLCRQLPTPRPLAAYVGASNGDDPSFYSIFEAAMDEAGVEQRRMIPSELEAEDFHFFEDAHLILLAGGDVERGWRAFERNGLASSLERRHREGALLIGVSAGSVQLGLGGWSPTGEWIETSKILPYLIGAHEEASGWRTLKEGVQRAGPHTPGYGVPFGGALLCHPDRTLEPLGKPTCELRLRGEEVVENLLFPAEDED